MSSMRNAWLACLLLLFPTLLHAQSREITLGGSWSFALDPVSAGEEQGWFRGDFKTNGWDQVTVPHCFTVDKRYHYFTGDVWYTRAFDKPAVGAGDRALLQFEAVFYKCKVWVNGALVGEHEGGYTPFTIDVTEHLQETNRLTLVVNNAWDTTTIPGAKTVNNFEPTSASQLYPWINFGGIVRPVHLLIRPSAYLQSCKVSSDLDLKRNTAALFVEARVVNHSGATVNADDFRLLLFDGANEIVLRRKSASGAVATGSIGIFRCAFMPIKNIKRWGVDHPFLYKAKGVLGKDTFEVNLGIRKIEVVGTQLLLNGEPLRMGGCNRPIDYPGLGSMDPDTVINRDMAMIKSGSMELSRIAHYPVSSTLLDWADRNGMLLISEAGNWQMTPAQLSDEDMRRKFRSQFKEMVEHEWNHPSVFAWSVGNEYQSHTPEGKSWTKDMVEYARSLDPTRLVTFASMFVSRDFVQKPEDEASQYVDFISTNIYGNHLSNLKNIHRVYPDKPVFVSEFGIRADQVKDESAREAHLRKAAEDFRQCADFLIGAAVWTFNDYESFFPGTNADGYRPWGLVTPRREPRAMYYTWQEEFSPATVSSSRSGNKVEVVVTARKDFPSYPLRGYQVRCGSKQETIAELLPGVSKTYTFEVGDSAAVIELVKPGGFVIVRKEILQ